jgi:uncharacterized repeat protein (TIGR01451 family)
VTATVDPSATAQLVNTVTITAANDTKPTNETATDKDNLTPQFTLDISKTDNNGGSSTTGSVGTAVPGGSITYTIVVSNNNGPSTAANQTVTDNMPAAITSDTWTAVASSGSSVVTSSGTGNISDNVTLLPGGTVTFTVMANISATASGDLTNIGNVPGAPPAPDTDHLLTAAPSSNPDLSKVTDPEFIQTAIQNTSSVSIFLQSVNDSLLGNLIGASNVTATIAPVSGPVQTVTLAKGLELPAGATLTVTGTRTVLATDPDPTTGSTTYVFNATQAGAVASTGQTLSQSPSWTVNLFQPSVAVTLSVDKSVAHLGDTVTYTGTISDTSSSDSPDLFLFSYSATVPTFTLPAGLTLSAPGSGGSNPTSYSFSYTHVVTTSDMNAPNPNGGVLSNTVNVDFHVTPTGLHTGDNAYTNDVRGTSPTVTTQIPPQNDTGVTKVDNVGGSSITGSVGSVVPGNSFTYTITVSNPDGPSTATGVGVSDPVPAGLTSFVWSGNGHTNVSGPISDTIASLAPGASVVYTVTATVDPSATAQLVNTVTITAANDTKPTNETATDKDNLTPQFDVSVTKVDNKGGSSITPSVGSVGVGASMTYTIVVKNSISSPSTASNVQVSDPLPANTTFVSATGGATYNAGTNTVSAIIASLAPGASVTYTVTVTVGVATSGSGNTASMTNTVTISAANDTNPANNTASDTDLVPLPACNETYYPFASTNPLTNVAFSESTALQAFLVSNGNIQVFYSDEHALALGVRQVTGGSNPGTYPVDALVGGTPMSPVPQSSFNPSTGAPYTPQGTNQAALKLEGSTDASGRPLFPSLFVTDLSNSNNVNDHSGDWQFGGTPIRPSAVFGTWKAFTKTISSTGAVTLTGDADPAKNGLNLGAGADAVPAGVTNLGYVTEIRWNISALETAGILIPGHSYRFYVIDHDGDQNKTGGDAGQACVNAVLPMPLTAAGTAAAQALAATAVPFGGVVPGVYRVSVDGLQGAMAQAEQARIGNAINDLNATLGSYGVTLIQVGSGSPDANFHIRVADTTSLGGAAQGILGDMEAGGNINLVSGWNWYTGSDPTQIGRGQYDFQTLVAHELGHTFGIDESADPASVMYGILAPGQVRRDLSATDLSLISQHTDWGQADAFATSRGASGTQETTLPILSQAGVGLGSPLAPARSSGVANTEAESAAAPLDNANDVSAALVVSSSPHDHASGLLAQAGVASAVLLGDPSVPLGFRSSVAVPVLTSAQTSPETASNSVLTAPLSLLSPASPSGAAWPRVLPFERSPEPPLLSPTAPSGTPSEGGGDDLVPGSVWDQLFRLEDNDLLPFEAATPTVVRPALADAVWQSLGDDGDLGLLDTTSASDSAPVSAALAWSAFLVGCLNGQKSRARKRRLLACV